MHETINNSVQAAAAAVERAQKLAACQTTAEICETTPYLQRFAVLLRGEG